jgi:hypothetical protein
MSTRLLAIALILTAPLFSCAVLTTHPIAHAPQEVAATYTLPKAIVTVVVHEDGDRVFLKGDNIKYVPDPDQVFAVNYNPSVFASDDVQIEVDKFGYLAKVSVTTDVVADDIIINVAKAVAAFPAATLPPGNAIATVSFDPTNTLDLDAANRHLSSIKKNLKIRLHPAASKAGPNAVAAITRRSYTGIAYRPLTPLVLELLRDEVVEDQITVLVPNASRIMTIPISRSGFVERVSAVEFESGVIAKIALKKPSEALAFVSIPIEVAKAIISVPAELIQLRVGATNAEKELYEAEKARMEAKKLLEDLLKSKDDPLQ